MIKLIDILLEKGRIPRKKGQKRKSSKHSDLYTDEDPKTWKKMFQEFWIIRFE